MLERVFSSCDSELFLQMMASVAAGWGVGKKVAATALGLLTGSGAVLAYEVDKSVRADLALHPPKIQWSHSGMLDSFDHASIRRGYQVYKQVRQPPRTFSVTSSKKAFSLIV